MRVYQQSINYLVVFGRVEAMHLHLYELGIARQQKFTAHIQNVLKMCSVNQQLWLVIKREYMCTTLKLVLDDFVACV